MTAGAAGRDHPFSAQSASPFSEASPQRDSTSRDETSMAGRKTASGATRAAGVLADRMAAALVHRELVRRLPDGQLYRASPADYWIPVEGTAGLGTRLDPMGGTITCQTRHVSRREAPQDVA